MRIAAPFTNDSRWRTIPDEYNLTYNENSHPEKLVDFCSIINDKRINIKFKDTDIDINSIKMAKQFNPNICVRLTMPQKRNIDELKENDISYFFDSRDFPCVNFSILESMITMGVSDIYPYDELCYRLDKVKEICEPKNIKTRMVLNRIASIDPLRGTKINSPIFFPRDEELSKYIDVGEFDCGAPYDWHKFNVYRKVYLSKQEWLGDLKDINLDLEYSFPHFAAVSDFNKRKMTCGRRCGFDSSCNHCFLLLDLAVSVADKGYILTKDAK